MTLFSDMKSADTPAKRLIVVLGMHRSGTSALTRALLCLGIDLGNKLMKPHPEINPKGFFEDMDLFELNEEILKTINMAWHHAAPIQPIDVARLQQHGFFLRAVEWLRQKTESVTLFGFKDPRIAKLSPFWQPVFQHCEFAPDYILALRHPLAIAHSLRKRDAFPLAKSYLLWLEHTLTSLQGVQNAHSILVDYDQLLDDPAGQLQRLAQQLDLPLDAMALLEYQNEFLDKSLRHSHYSAQDLLIDPACPPLVREVYEILLACSRAETQPASSAWRKQIAQWQQEWERIRPVLQLVDEFSEREQALRQQNAAQQTEWMALIRQIVQQQPPAIAPLFDAEWYLQQNPDVVAAGLDPYQHFVHDGVREGRWPSANIAATARQGLENWRQEREHETTAQLLALQQQAAAEKNQLDAEYQTRLQTLQQQHTEQEQTHQQRSAELNQILQQTQVQAIERETGHASQQQLLQRELLSLQQQHTERERETATQLLALQQQAAAEKNQLDAEYQTRLQMLQQQAEQEQSFNTQLLTKQRELNQISQQWHDAQQAYAQSINDLEQQLQTIQTSYVWRWTVPLRAIARRFSADNIDLIKKVHDFALPIKITPLNQGNTQKTVVATHQQPDQVESFVMKFNNPIKIAQSVEDLLSYYDEDFVRCAYQTLLGREPDEDGLRYYLIRVRSGVDKMEILAQIRCGVEGKKRKCNIEGLDKHINSYRRFLPLRWPGFLSEKKSLRAIENKLYGLESVVLHELLKINLSLENFSELLNVGDKFKHNISKFDQEFWKNEAADPRKKNEVESSPPFGSVSLHQKKEMLKKEQIGFKKFVDSIINDITIYVVIPSFNDYNVLSGCLRSIQVYGQKYINKIIISDDCSTDEKHINYLDFLKKSSDESIIPIEVIFNNKNKGFSANVNSGISIVPENADIFLLNSDTELRNYSITSLCAVSRINGGISGGRLLYPDMKIQHAGGFRNFNALDWFEHRYRMQNMFHLPALASYNVFYCTGAALYIPAETRKIVGSFDENFKMGFEDVDYCIRAWKNSLPVTYVGSAEIVHHESVTRGKEAGSRELLSKNYFWNEYKSFFIRKITNNFGKIQIIFVTKDTGLGGGHRVVFQFAEFLAGLQNEFSVEIWSLSDQPDWFNFHNNVIFKKFSNFEMLECDLRKEYAIKIATWWETAPVVWKASVQRGLPMWLSQDMESSYYKNRDPINEMKAISSYAPEFIYLTDYKWLSSFLSTQLFYHSHFIGLGVDKVFRHLDLSRKPKSVLVCARGEPLKGFDLSLDIICKLDQLGFNITIYGVDKSLAPSGININFVYKPTDEDLNVLYNSHEFYLQTSVHEGLGLPPLEAMACQCIPVLTDAFGNREYIDDGNNCFVIPRDAQAALSVFRNCNYSTSIDSLINGMRETVSRYSWEVAFRRLYRLLILVSKEPIYGKTSFPLD